MFDMIVIVLLIFAGGIGFLLCLLYQFKPFSQNIPQYGTLSLKAPTAEEMTIITDPRSSERDIRAIYNRNFGLATGQGGRQAPKKEMIKTLTVLHNEAQGQGQVIDNHNPQWRDKQRVVIEYNNDNKPISRTTQEKLNAPLVRLKLRSPVVHYDNLGAGKGSNIVAIDPDIDPSVQLSSKQPYQVKKIAAASLDDGSLMVQGKTKGNKEFVLFGQPHLENAYEPIPKTKKVSKK
jgi:hypothetical protein